jgi:hypothetical protein
MGNPFSKFWSALMAASTAFRQSYLGNDWVDQDYTTFEARQMRYKILWAMYENSAYQALHRWTVKYKADYGLYRFVRAIYNPSNRLGEFWKSHLMGGRLDVVDGQAGEAGALPIQTTNESLRAPIATLWRWSNWQIKKDVLSLWGSVMGDVGVKIIDDPIREKVYLKLVHPGTIKAVDLDDWGNVKGYELEELRPDPRKGDSKIKVMYREVVTRLGDNVNYQTYLDDRLYAWDDSQGSTWSEPYGFVPMVMIQHNNVGLDYGMSELFPGLAKFREADDIASKLSDQIRKLVDAPWLMAGVKQGELQTSTPAGTDANPQKGRETVPMIFSGPDAKAQPLVAPLDIASTSAYIVQILQGIEADYPEMTADKNNATGDISGRALRINRAPAENKVQQRRPNYDDAIVRAHQMGIAIGGMRGYEGFEGFGLDSYASGDLDHQIADRPVFDKDPLDDIEKEAALWTAAQAAKNAGVPLPVFLKNAGWDEEKIAELEASEEYQMRMEAQRVALEAAKAGPQVPPSAATNRRPTQNGKDN